MKHSVEMFKASNTTYDTPKKLQFKLLLGNIAAYNGEIPLTRNEIKDRLSISISALKRIISESKYTGEIYEKDGRLFVNPSSIVDYCGTDTALYVKYFKFLSSPEFMAEDRRVQRFVLDMLCQHVYLPSRKYVTYVKNLISSGTRDSGTFNVRTVGEMNSIIEKAGKYLNLRLECRQKRDWLVVVHGLNPEFEEMGSFDSEGALLWVSQKMYAAGFVVEVIDQRVKNQLAKVMEYYYSQVGYDLAYNIFVGALDDLLYSSAFHSMIYSEIQDEKQLDEISAYFKNVAESSERFVALGITLEYDLTSSLIEDASRIAKKEGKDPNKIKELLDAKAHRNNLEKKLHLIESMWIHALQRGNRSIYLNQRDSKLQTVLHKMKDLQSLMYEFWLAEN
ncbi:hypothetical protein [Paenibacillus xylanilyticus]|uniref:Uncharacterized protein n=1 Tax=Paenibacillus xylanilyticus TaxID=248903 RepID=A0A7Y6EUC3_9BACL|nr:hypothetical protein [Paenibacillus xylanilyticus]NUU74603.1 hypothetical protein [Paenibacillus xylanilyticus]